MTEERKPDRRSSSKKEREVQAYLRERQEPSKAAPPTPNKMIGQAPRTK